MSGQPTMEERFKQAEADAEKQYENFDPRRLTESASKVHEVFVKGLGKVKFGALTFNDIIEIDKAGGGMQEKGVRYIHAMLKKAYPELTFEDVKKWDSNHVADITMAVAKAGFFRQQTTPTGNLG